MTTFAAKADLTFEPAAAISFETAEVAYTTPPVWRRTLGGLALINGVSATLRYRLATSGGATDAAAVLRVKTGAGALLSEINLTASPDSVVSGREVVDVGAVSGGSTLVVEVEVTGNVAGMSGALDAVLEAETPVVIGGC